MEEFRAAMKRVIRSFELVSARFQGFHVVESPYVKPGEVLVEKDPRRIVIYKPTEIQRIVRLGVREGHPWFKDPLDPLKLVR